MTPPKVLHVIGQRPEMTGSGIYMQAMIKESRKHGLSTHRVAGVPEGSVDPATDPENASSTYVFFESQSLDFPVVGMSDAMPYDSTMFKSLKGKRLAAYKAAFTRAVKMAVQQFNPDIIHTNHLFLLSALVRKLFPKLPMVTTCHGTDLRQYNNCPHLRDFVKPHIQQVDRIIALTTDQKEAIRRVYEIPPDRIAAIGGGYDHTVFTRAPKATPGTVQVLYAGKLNRSKGVPWLLKSLMKIKPNNWHLHLAGGGSGPEFDECMALAEQLGKKATYHGLVSHQRLAELMKQAHIQVLPSFFEGLPLVLFEGLASGCRIITTDLSGFNEIFGNARPSTVHRIPLPPLESIDQPYAKDEPALRDALCASLLEMLATARKSPDFDDPEADQIAADYTWPRIFERTLSVYYDVVQNH